VKRIVEMMALRPDMGKDEVLDSACRVLDVDRNRLRKPDVEIEFDRVRKSGQNCSDSQRRCV
jgi:hypothetical protein